MIADVDNPTSQTLKDRSHLGSCIREASNSEEQLPCPDQAIFRATLTDGAQSWGYYHHIICVPDCIRAAKDWTCKICDLRT